MLTFLTKYTTGCCHTRSVGTFEIDGSPAIITIAKLVETVKHFVQREAPKISKLVQISPITMVYGTYNELVTGANLNQQTSLGGLAL